MVHAHLQTITQAFVFRCHMEIAASASNFSLNAPPFSFDPKISQSFKNVPSQPHYFMRIGLKFFRGKEV